MRNNFYCIDEKQKLKYKEIIMDDMFQNFVPKLPQKKPKEVIKMHEILNTQRFPKSNSLACIYLILVRKYICLTL